MAASAAIGSDSWSLKVLRAVAEEVRAPGQRYIQPPCCSMTLGKHASLTFLIRTLPSQVVKSVAEGRDVERRGALALALGAIHRAKGGLALQVGSARFSAC
jgi:hypothetical protein